MLFVLDENVPESVARILREQGHSAESILEHVPRGSVDPVVATVSQDLGAVLISFDGDFEKIAPRIPKGHRRRFRRLSRIWMRCREPDAAKRFLEALTLVESEYAIAQSRSDVRMHIWIGGDFIRIQR